MNEAQDNDRELRDANAALLRSSVRQHELAEQARRAEKAANEHRERLAVELAITQQLQAVSMQMIRAGDVTALYGQILDASVAIMDADYASMQQFHPERGPGGELTLLTHRNFSPQAAESFARLRPASKSVCAMTLRKRQRVIVPDVAACGEMAGSDAQEALLQSGIRAVQSTPLVSRNGQLLGMLSTHWGRPYQPAEDKLRLLDVLARQAADLIERSRVEQALRDSEQQLQRANATLEQRIAERTAELERRAEQLRQLTAELTSVEQRERRRLAKTLHDDLQQLLVATKMTISRAAGRIDDGEISHDLAEAQNLIDQCVAGSRSLAMDLSPPMLYRQGLVPAVEWLAGYAKEHYGLRLDLQTDHDVKPVANDDLLAFVYQAIRELVLNIVKHADTDQARLTLSGQSDGYLQVVIEDEGKGCDPKQILHHSAEGFGLLGIQERLQGYGGGFNVETSPGGGCRITMWIPLAPPLRKNLNLNERKVL